ncbi:MAG: hypothetical protein IT236_17650 [Bacteroidia bacterium]|nr:hypothetical protein [Bacteroidia bacterium]
MNRSLVILMLASGFFASCEDKKEEDKDDLVETADTVKTAVLNVNGELFSVPSPIQTALLIQKTGVSYDKSVLSVSNKVNNFSTDYSRAFNLGIYGADLGYVSLYNQTQDALSYLTAIKQLSDKLGISAAFDAATMERLSKNITNKDSMMVLVGLAYRSSDSYLKNNRRNDISTVILAGGWIESMHFSMAAYKSKPDATIRERIAEQKQALNSLIKILGSNTSPEVTEITTLLSDLSKIYEGVKLTYKYVPPITDSIHKITTINSITEVVISDEQLSQIAAKVNEIRNKITITTK